MARILGFDQSYTSSGYCVSVDSNVTAFGTFKTNKELEVYKRAIETADFVVKLVQEHNVEEIHFEGLAFGIRGDATRDLAGLLFTIITTVIRQIPDTKYTIIAPTSLKKFATGTGKSDKKAMIENVPPEVMEQFVTAKFKKTTGLADITDAYWLSLYK